MTERRAETLSELRDGQLDECGEEGMGRNSAVEDDKVEGVLAKNVHLAKAVARGQVKGPSVCRMAWRWASLGLKPTSAQRSVMGGRRSVARGDAEVMRMGSPCLGNGSRELAHRWARLS